MRVAVLALQGAFVEHEQVLAALGADFLELRQKRDLDQPFDALILPGGESTVQGKLLRDLDMLKPLTGRIRDGLPVLGTCAGLILLAEGILPQEPGHFKTLPVTVRRNAYGRQLGSFYTEEAFGGLGPLPMTFIRAPYIAAVHSPEAEMLAAVDGKITAVRYRSQLGVAFHPELGGDLRVHRYFLRMAAGHR